MKITGDLTTLAEQYEAKPAQLTTSEAGKSFGDTLANELDFDATPASVDGTNQAEVVDWFLNGGEIPSEWYQINGVVDSIDRYGQALGDQTYTLKDLEPLAADMEEQAQSLSSSLEEGEFGSLREVAEEVLAQAQIAAIKFRRGDYV